MTDRERIHQALGKAQAGYLVLSGTRSALREIQDEKVKESAKQACRAAWDLECDLLKALATTEDKPSA